eukprot:218173-Rhodomonas_salina.1
MDWLNLARILPRLGIPTRVHQVPGYFSILPNSSGPIPGYPVPGYTEDPDTRDPGPDRFVSRITAQDRSPGPYIPASRSGKRSSFRAGVLTSQITFQKALCPSRKPYPDPVPDDQKCTRILQYTGSRPGNCDPRTYGCLSVHDLREQEFRVCQGDLGCSGLVEILFKCLSAADSEVPGTGVPGYRHSVPPGTHA